jgi:hypothetical protein
MAYVYQDYPKMLYHPSLAPEGKVFQSAEETSGLEQQGWVDNPGKFPIALFTESLAKLSPMRFEQFVADVIRESGEFDQVEMEVPIGGLRSDIIGSKRAGTPMEKKIVFEVKKVAIATADLVRAVHRQMTSLAPLVPNVKCVLVVSGRLSDDAQATAEHLELSVWDAGDLFPRMNDALANRWFPGMALQTATSPVAHRRVDALQETLSTIQPGEHDALKYQRWVADALEYLFVPPLGPVHYQDADAANRNRRDIIIDNWASEGFWAQLRGEYSAHQIVVDAKNYSDPIEKRSIIELSHYLKPYGCGMFGIVATRKPASQSACYATREEWIGGRKMILIVDDRLMREMLRLKARGAKAEEVLRIQISEFRKSL